MLPAHHPALRIAAAPALIERGCVQLIRLEEIRDKIGPSWEKRKDAVWAHLESLLSHKLGATDFYAQIDDLSFLVSMPAAREGEAQVFCLRVAHDLHVSLLGRCDTSSLRIARVRAIQDDSVQTTPVEGEALNALAERAGLQKDSSNAGLSSPDKNRSSAVPSYQFHHKFIPMWDAQREAVTTCRCTSNAEQSGGESVESRPRFELALAISRINDAARRLTAHLAAGERFIMWIPLPYDSLSTAVGRMEIAGVCRSLSSELRPYLIFEICDLPQGVPQSRVSELVGCLKPFCRGVAALLPARTSNFSLYMGSGLLAVGLSLAGGAAAEMSNVIFRLSLAVKKHDILSFVLDVPHAELVQAARTLGINLMSGPLIGRSSDIPQLVRLLSARNIPQTSMSLRANRTNQIADDKIME